MGQFKPMVKMYTDEPSVILKLKKGGKVHHKSAKHEKHEEHGHKSMAHHAMGGMHHAFESEHGSAPKKPSMSERRKAMNPNMYKKGGKVEHKLDGGMMGAPMGAPMAPMARTAILAMDPRARMARAAMVRKAITGMKKGGHMGMEKHIEKLEKELHHHESMPMSEAHHKKMGGMAHHAKGGKVHPMTGHPEGSLKHHKEMCKHYEKKCKEGGTAHDHKMLKHHMEMCKGGKYASGGMIDRDETKTTIENNAKPYLKTRMHSGQMMDKAHGTKGIKESNAGGYAMGGTIEGNAGQYLNTKMHDGSMHDMVHGTGEIHESNAGGYKRGGKTHKMHHKASGGMIPSATMKGMKEDKLKGDTYEDGNWENRPADTATAGVKNRRTGEVHESNAGGFRHGGHASKKHYATGGNVVDDGKAVKMPKHFVSRPVANSLQSGTFKRGGKVKFAEGGTEDLSKGAYDRHYADEKKENEAMRDAILGAPKRAYEAVKGMFSSSKPPEGSVTKTEKSVTVAPPKKRGGSMRK
jgi:hypothetical protein